MVAQPNTYRYFTTSDNKSAASFDPEERIAVADQLNTPEEVLLLLADDDDVDVRYAIAENHNISKNVLLKLRDDPNPYVAHRAWKTLARLTACAQGLVRLYGHQSMPADQRGKITMLDSNNFSKSPVRSVCQDRHSDSELECKRLLIRHEKSGKANDMKVVTWLHSLAQALEGQAKFVEGLDARLQARNMLISIMLAS